MKRALHERFRSTRSTIVLYSILVDVDAARQFVRRQFPGGDIGAGGECGGTRRQYAPLNLLDVECVEVGA